MSDPLTSRALTTAAALIQAAAIGDRVIMREILTTLTPESGSGEIVGRIIRETAPLFFISVEDVLSKARHREISHARFVISYASHLLGFGTSHVARQLGVDHSSVSHGIARVESSPALRKMAEQVAHNLGWNGGIAA